jgi:MFS transporter, DHA2 family, multidrug resistance protein
MIGPILGPVLGGWLTEQADWRWVFYINLPIGLLAFYGIARYLPETKPAAAKLDQFGFVALSLTVGLLQLFLDRGVQLDWFNSSEIRMEATGCAIALAFFIVHTWTCSGSSFLNRALLKDRNFVTGSLFAFVVGMVLYSTMSLLPMLLQGVLAYPVVFTGEVMAPRGIGTMLAMLFFGRLAQRVDLRVIMALGFSLTSLSLYQMTQMTLDMDSSTIILSGFIQGLGIGFTFVPLSAATFFTLAPELRNEGTPIYSLMRNIGGSVGISIAQALLTQSTARAHAELSIDLNASNPMLQTLPEALSAYTPTGLAALNYEVTRQAEMIGYITDFRMMMCLSLLALPLLLLIRSAKSAS